MNSVQKCTSGEAVNGLLAIRKNPGMIVDVTFGNGTFWDGSLNSQLGGDRNPIRAKDFCADFSNLPFRDRSVNTVVFDPPFHPFVNSAEEDRFSGMGSDDKELKAKFLQGVGECWRVTQSYLLVKCQGFVHNHKPQWMPLWAISVCGEPFEWLIVWREGKRVSGRWKSNLSLRRNHADYLLFNRAGNHR